MTRPTKDEYFLQMAKLVATRGTCARRQVGCVLVNKRGHVLATGYNGPPAGYLHCIDSPCAGAVAPSGAQLDECFAVHAEQNALLQCHDAYAIHTAYVTVAPCAGCLKLFLNTSCRCLVVGDWYAPEHQVVLRRWWRDPVTDAPLAIRVLSPPPRETSKVPTRPPETAAAEDLGGGG